MKPLRMLCMVAVLAVLVAFVPNASGRGGGGRGGGGWGGGGGGFGGGSFSSHSSAPSYHYSAPSFHPSASFSYHAPSAWTNSSTPFVRHAPSTWANHTTPFVFHSPSTTTSPSMNHFAPNAMHSWTWSPGNILGNRSFAWRGDQNRFRDVDHDGDRDFFHHHRFFSSDFFFAPFGYVYYPNYSPYYSNYPYYDPYAYYNNVPLVTVPYDTSGHAYNPPPVATSPAPYGYANTAAPAAGAAGMITGYVDYFAPLLWYAVASADPVSWQWYLAYLCSHLVL